MAIIFCHTQFDNSDLERLHCPKPDSDNLKDTMENLGFEVTVHHDQKREDIMQIVDEGKL
jgi:hypothetical protein